ncbi:MAG: hypothetical protein ABI416_03340 [Ginsengibacter sp.]
MFRKPDYPGIKPPWGTLNAVNLNTGDVACKIPLGGFAELAAKGHPNTGTQLFGGGIVTAGGLVFIGASQDEKFSAVDKIRERFFGNTNSLAAVMRRRRHTRPVENSM